jgi:sensor domain CHASE-containing protein
VHRDNAKSHTAKLLVPIVSISFVAIVVIFALLLWSGKEVDRISRERDKSIVSLVIAQSIERVAHAQESSTIWDLAVRKVRERPLDYRWLDFNLGTWFHSYAGHDEVYVLSPDDAPLYAMENGLRVDAASYRSIGAVADPLVKELRGLSLPAPQGDGSVAMLSPGVADLAILHGRPAIVSVKPIISDSGETIQRRGAEAVHISVVYLDGKFLSQLSRQYGLAGTHFSRSGPRWSETALPLRSRDGRWIGYFIWRPFAPGDAVTLNVAPLLLIALAFAGFVVFLLAQRLGRNTMDLEASQAQAQHLALHDVLTGLPNRAMFENRLDAALARCRRDASRLAPRLALPRSRPVQAGQRHAGPCRGRRTDPRGSTPADL